jgi:acetyl esterase
MPYIDPQVVPIIANMKQFRQQRGPIHKIPVATIRTNFNQDIAAWNEQLPQIAKVSDFKINTKFGEIPVRLYDPDTNSKKLATLLFIHGGGWIVGNLDTNERFLRLLSKRSGLRILSIDYPLAPENPFPIALDCIVEITKTVYENGSKWGIDSNNLCIGGDSAGANLALTTALELKSSNENMIKYISLIYGAFSPVADKPSFKKFGQGEYGMGIEAMEHFWGLYLQQPENQQDPRAVPLLADVSGLPPVHIMSAGLDALQDDSFLLAEKLRLADVKYYHSHYPGMVHGFVSLCGLINEGDRAISDLSANLYSFFNKTDGRDS